VFLGDVAEVIAGQSPPGESYNDAGKARRSIRARLSSAKYSSAKLQSGLLIRRDSLRLATFSCRCVLLLVLSTLLRSAFALVEVSPRLDLPRSLAHLLRFLLPRSMEEKIIGDTGTAFASISRGDIEKIKIPLRRWRCRRRSWRRSRATRKSSTAPAPSSTTTAPHPIHPGWPIPKFEEAPFQIIDGDRGSNYPSKEDFSTRAIACS